MGWEEGEDGEMIQTGEGGGRKDEKEEEENSLH